MKVIAITVLGLGLAVAASAGAASDEVAQISARVQKAYEGAKDLSATFTQQTMLKSAAGRPGRKVSGRLFFKKPGMMRWEFTEGMLFVSDGKTLWQYDEEEEEVIVNRFGDTSSVTALNFLAGMGSLTRDFDVARAAPKGEKPDRGKFLSLTPKGEDVQLQKIVLVVSPKTWLAEEVYLTDQLGNETHLVFQDVKVNKGLKKDRFVFVPPEGTSVIDPAAMGGQ
jgi:outer membrane lipoprotein carrier protein